MTWLWILLGFVAFYGGLITLCVFMIRREKRQKKIYTVIKNYEDNAIPMQTIVRALHIEFEVVAKDVDSMSDNINFPLLKGAYIDYDHQTLVLANDATDKKLEVIKNQLFPKQKTFFQKKIYITVTCKYCGAENKKEKGSVKECEYCGSPL